MGREPTQPGDAGERRDHVPGGAERDGEISSQYSGRCAVKNL